MDKITYYRPKTHTTGEPMNAIWRFFEGDREPEYLGMDLEWIPDATLLARVSSGEVTDEDIISEDEATRLIKEWQASKQP